MSVWTKIMLNIGRMLLNWGANMLYNYVDKDKNGEISKEEIEQVYGEIKSLLNRK